MSVFTREFGSKTAKGWFRNEDEVVIKFNNRKDDTIAQEWLVALWYSIIDIEYVKAEKIPWHHKADVQVKIELSIKLKSVIECENLQVKLVSNGRGYNQIDKRRADTYQEMRNIPNDVLDILKRFCWELKPTINNPKDERRMFLHEFSQEEQIKVTNFFEENKMLIVSDIIKGNWPFSADWYLIINMIKDEDIYNRWVYDINYVMNFFAKWDVQISSRWSLKIWSITLQRKGWDNWRKTANMLQFKLDPTKILE